MIPLVAVIAELAPFIRVIVKFSLCQSDPKVVFVRVIVELSPLSEWSLSGPLVSMIVKLS